MITEKLKAVNGFLKRIKRILTDFRIGKIAGWIFGSIEPKIPAYAFGIWTPSKRMEASPSSFSGTDYRKK